MKILDVITQLRLLLPKYTNLFSDELTISNVEVTADTTTLTCQHGLRTGDVVTIVNSVTFTSISGVSKEGNVVTFYTETDHDLTEDWHETITIGGFTDEDWNDSFTLLGVPNRKTFEVQSTNDEPTLNGNEYLEEERMDGINGYYSITVVNSSTFTISGDFLAGEYRIGNVYTANRIEGAINFDRALELYNTYNTNELFIFVIPKDADVSQSQYTTGDEVAALTRGVDIRLKRIDGFLVYVFANVSNDMTVIETRDTIAHTLLQPLLKCLHGAEFDTGLADETVYKTIAIGDGQALYDRATYVHVFDFQTLTDITYDDAVENTDTRAYRDTDLTQTIGTSDPMTVTIDHDDEPLER